MLVKELHVERDNLAAISLVQSEIVPSDGEVLFRVESFALTANNMTYAAHGVDMAYWGFFRAPERFGIVPVWGFASVVDSRADGIAVGQRFYGYWPMASHAQLRPGKINPSGFVDTAAHRAQLPPVYNNYVAASAAFGPETVQALFRPLYTTSFVLDLMFQGSSATTLVLTSASSKTALGLAQAAKGRQRVVGLTSPANMKFVESTGYFDEVLNYADVGKLASGTGTVALVDFSGNGAVRYAVHSALGSRLIESHVVGDTHWDAANSNALPGVAAQLFFAPSVIVDRVAQWGAEGFQTRLAVAWAGFMASTGWLRVVEGSGAQAVIDRWRAMAAGRIDPAEGMILSV